MIVPDHNPISRARAALRRHAQEKAMKNGYESAKQHALAALREAGNSGDAEGVKRWAEELSYLRLLGEEGFSVLHGDGQPDLLAMVDRAVLLYDQDAEVEEVEDPNEVIIEVTLYRDTGEIYVWPPETEDWDDTDTFNTLSDAAAAYDPDRVEGEAE